jgi:hypothetical protein
MAEAWSLKGTYFETCNCEVACPCVFLSPPTTGECTVLVGWHIEEGRYASVALDGLNVALAVHAPGHMATTKWKAALYFDDRASEGQKNALLIRDVAMFSMFPSAGASTRRRPPGPGRPPGRRSGAGCRGRGRGGGRHGPAPRSRDRQPLPGLGWRRGAGSRP